MYKRIQVLLCWDFSSGYILILQWAEAKSSNVVEALSPWDGHSNVTLSSQAGISAPEEKALWQEETGCCPARGLEENQLWHTDFLIFSSLSWRATNDLWSGLHFTWVRIVLNGWTLCHFPLQSESRNKWKLSKLFHRPISADCRGR